MTKLNKMFAAILVLALMLSLGACKSRTNATGDKQKGARENWEISENPREESSSSQESESEPEDELKEDLRPVLIAEDFLSAARTGERYAIQSYADYNTLFALRDGQNADWILKQILMRLRYEVVSSDIGDDKAVVSVKFTNVDMGIVLPLFQTDAAMLEYKNAISDVPMEQNQLDIEYEKMFAGLMLKNESAKTEKLVDIVLKKADDNWKITATSALGNAMLGGYIDAQSAPLAAAVQMVPAVEIEAVESSAPESTPESMSEDDIDAGEYDGYNEYDRDDEDAVYYDEDYVENE